MKNEEFVEYCKVQLRDCYEKAKARKSDEQQKYRVEGLLQAVRLLDILPVEDVKLMIEREHISVFGESVLARKARKASLADLKEASPDNYFDIPTVIRKP
jgi:hypothetical protein